MNTIKEVKELIRENPQHWSIHLMNFVDDFRYYKDADSVAEAFRLSDVKIDALLAATVAYLCDEQKMLLPAWLENVPPSRPPFFVFGIENLKAISLVESPTRFRQRNVFVLANFLSRV